ncbi:cation-independent mannose-6-phosphate receptor-like [Oppia nitens]|uniref:cation-independent mannose-6-phosphate receptor-like n=1 Tax=Oppia nitens TaxID=1686743 RepID=UPI0023DA4380|nr:cation-independent mannose-6-phosphate receptor-like [Oppia nitens]
MSRLTAITVIGILVIDFSYLLAISTAVADNNGLSCDNMSGYDLSTINEKTYKYIHNYTNTSTNKTDSFDVLINICRVFDTKDKTPEVCFGRQICGHKTTDKTPIGYRLKSADFVPDNGSHKEYIKVVYDGSECDIHRILNYSMTIIFYCGEDSPNLNLEMSTTCGIQLNYTTKSVCKTSTNNSMPSLAPIVNCFWENHTHYIDFNQLVKKSNNYKIYRLSTTTSYLYIYYINVCRPLNQIFEPFSDSSINNCGPNAAICQVNSDTNDSALNLGEPTSGPIRLFDESLNLFYENGSPCPVRPHEKLRTRIKFVCDPLAGIENMIVNEPGSETMDAEDCAYFIEWRTSAVCNYIERTKGQQSGDHTNLDVLDQRDELIYKDGFLEDNRLDAYINVSALMGTTFNVNEFRELDNNKTDNYTYVINLSKPELSTDYQCSEAGVCQTKGDFRRDLGSVKTIKYYLRGHELQMALQSKGGTRGKCGKNANKNVTTIFRLHCSSSAGVGEPEFMYESNDCDYVFNWETSMVCPINFIKQEEYIEYITERNKSQERMEKEELDHLAKSTEDNQQSGGHTNLWIGIIIVICILGIICALLLYKPNIRQSVFGLFRSRQVNSQSFIALFLASHEKDNNSNKPKAEVVIIDGGNNSHQYSNTIAGQPSSHVPYYSIYDDSDVDLLT